MKLSAWLALVSWLAVVFGLLKIAEAAKLSAFDPSQTLSIRSIEQSFEPGLASALLPLTSNLSNRVIHIRSGDCICESLAENHSLELANSLAKLGFLNESVNLDTLPELTEFIPSTPAVVVFNSQQQLLYLGPYAVGLGCFTNNSLSKQITNMSQVDYLGAQINADVQGCYCSTQISPHKDSNFFTAVFSR